MSKSVFKFVSDKKITAVCLDLLVSLSLNEKQVRLGYGLNNTDFQFDTEEQASKVFEDLLNGWLNPPVQASIQNQQEGDKNVVE